MSFNKPFCVVPFVEAFSGLNTQFRNCCSASPTINSLEDQSFEEWWADDRLLAFKNSLYNQTWLNECASCKIQESFSGSSFRTAVDDQVIINKNFGLWPSRWNLKFGNICNLACWTCGESSSSVIAQHKRLIGILPVSFTDPNKEFNKNWPDLKKNILKSYDYHDIVTLTLIGGEPIYNPSVLDFLSMLVKLNLSKRTRIEFHTNGTKINSTLFEKNIWNYVCVFISLDAVGRKSEWLRYGSVWNDIDRNIKFYKSTVDYLQVHCTLSVLNINDLHKLDTYCNSLNLNLKIYTLNNPSFMSLIQWPQNSSLIDIANSNSKFDHYYQLIGKNQDPSSIEKLREYIVQFSPIRKSLLDYDPYLAQVLNIT
jgi:sulfatase maturation enzyme AslB (radical SAM superfamily)